MLGDRLWDDAGREWTTTLGTWVNAEEVAARLASRSPAVTHGFGRPFRTLTAQDAASYWKRMEQHFAVPGQTGAAPDEAGLTYSAQLWRRDDHVMIGFVEFC